MLSNLKKKNMEFYLLMYLQTFLIYFMIPVGIKVDTVLFK